MKPTKLAITTIIGYAWGLPKPSLQLQDNFDEPKDYGWCIDLAGWGDTLQIDVIQAHSCKPDDIPYTDQQFYPVKNSIVGYGLAKGLCLKAKSDESGSELTTAKCDLDDDLQDICWQEDGTLRLNDDELDKCIVSADGEMRDIIGLYKARDMTLE